MTSEVSICNLALSWLAKSPITSLDDADNKAILCKANYDSVRDSTLESRNWTFAMKYVTLTYDPARDTPDGRHSILVPTDCIRVHRVFSPGTDESYKFSWVRMGKYIVCGSTEVDVQYVARIDDPNEYSPLFIEAMAAHLAAYLAMPLTENKDLKNEMFDLYFVKLREAASSDGMQGTNEVYRSNELTGVRRM